MGTQTLRYSEAFKRQVVQELASGRLRSHAEARERYGIGGAATVARWVDKYGPAHMARRIIRVETTMERNQIKVLKSRLAELERALVDSRVEESLYKAYFEIACQEFGVPDVEALKKNIASKLCGRPPSRRVTRRA